MAESEPAMNTNNTEPQAGPRPGEPAWQVAGCLALLLVALHVVAGPKVRLSEWRLETPTANTNFLEALAWYSGRLDIPERVHDSALYKDRVYSVNPPLFSFLSYLATVMGAWQGEPVGQFYSPWLVTLVALPLPLLGYWALLRATGRPPWAALLTFAWIAGTPVLACLVNARSGAIHHIDHLLSQTGLMLIAISLLGRRSISGALLGLVITAWSRPTTLAFVLPIIWAAWCWDPQHRRARLIATAVGLAVTIAVPMTLNKLKFGSPFESGYKYIYEGRTDELARRGRQALFSPAYVARNAWYMNLEVPGWEMGQYGIRPTLDSYGASIWFTMPVLLFVLVDARRWWRDAQRRALILASLPVIAALLCYHNTGYVQPGYYRFALDFIPVWLVTVAAYTMGRIRSPLTLAAIAWSVLYFNMVVPVG